MIGVDYSGMKSYSNVMEYHIKLMQESIDKKDFPAVEAALKQILYQSKAMEEFIHD